MSLATLTKSPSKTTEKVQARRAVYNGIPHLRTWAKRVWQKTNGLDRRKKMSVLLDVVGSCNLRCPSCPVGNSAKVNPTGLIDKNLFSELIAKADTDYKLSSVCLFNWAEPMLNPELPELVRIVKSRGLVCHLSSNLNVLRDDIDPLLLAGPDTFRISLSGFTQPVYVQSHAGGNIERVKENMKKLAAARRRTLAWTRFTVYYHKYKHNLHEAPLMRAYARSLGFRWKEDWAYYMGMDNLISYMEGTLSTNETQFIDQKFALPIRDALNATAPYRNASCELLKKQLVFDLRGNLLPCCSVYDYQSNLIGNFLEMSPHDVQRAKESATACEKCVRHGVHVYGSFQGHPQLRGIYDQMVQKNLEPQLVQLTATNRAA